MTTPKTIKVFLFVAILIAIIAVFAYISLFSAPQKNAEAERFVVGLNDDTSEVAANLKAQGFVKNLWGYKLAYRLKGGHFIAVDEIQEGAYKISKSMSAWKIADVLLHEKPYMKWVVIPEGFRKEQIAELLTDALGWDSRTKSEWVNKYTAMQFDYVEGVYFPDTYLIPIDESPLQVADRLRAKFNEKFAPYQQEALKQNIKWTTLIKVASIVQREAANKEDMPLVAGIIWNRLLKGMKLEVDATVQYARDTRNAYENDPCEDPTSYARERDICYKSDLLQEATPYIGIADWWTPITTADIQHDSLYNTYKHTGLPPHPITNPGLDAINAALHSTETECLYYLHDSTKTIHCTKTYEEHQINIEKYLQ